MDKAFRAGDELAHIEDSIRTGEFEPMITYQLIKFSQAGERSIFQSNSPSEIMSIAKKLNKKVLRHRIIGTSYAVEPAICTDCEYPFVSAADGTWGFCGCEPF